MATTALVVAVVLVLVVVVVVGEVGMLLYECPWNVPKELAI